MKIGVIGPALAARRRRHEAAGRRRAGCYTDGDKSQDIADRQSVLDTVGDACGDIGLDSMINIYRTVS